MPALIHSRMTLHQGRVFKLVNENYTLDNGVTADMDFIQHPGAVAVVPMLNQEDVILIKQYRHAVREFIWEIPAGTIDSQESPMGCARRELIEETGYSAGEWHQLGGITPLPGYSDERIHIFLASDLKTAEQNLDKDEMLSVHRLQFKAAVQMILTGDIQDGKTISGLFLALNWLNKG
jgi:ADP-ribose pyrophosphatase